MKRLIIGMMIFVSMGLFACGNARQKQEVSKIQSEKKRTFQLPEVPVMLKTPEQRAVYVAQHYWDHFDFRDTVYAHLPEITEQAAVNYMDILQMISSEDALTALTTLTEKAAVEPVMLDYFWEILSKYWYNPNSPMKNENMFILLCKAMERASNVQAYVKDRAVYERRLAEKNRVGTKAADIVYTLASGKQGHLYGLKAPYILVFFHNPDCHTCADIKQNMQQSFMLKKLVVSGQMKVLTIYPDEDVALWRNHLNEMPDEWINAYDKGQVLTMEERYVLSSIPSFYLLDQDKKVLLKDADWAEVIHFLKKNNST